MTHPLRPREVSDCVVAELGYERGIAGVLVKRGNKDALVVVVESEAIEIFVIKPDARVSRLPDRFTVLDTDGNRITPLGEFWINTESFDPYHALCDVDPKRRTA